MEKLSEEKISEILTTNTILAYKPIGITPKELVDYYLEQLRPFYPMVKGCFVGRLDPMAHGLTKIFLNEKCKEAKDEILLKSDKQYRFKILIGLSTISNDILGWITNSSPITISKEQLTEALEKMKGINKQELPIHSSFVVRNETGLKNPLWWWTKENRLDEVKRPILERNLYRFSILDETSITIEDLLTTVKSRIDLIDKKHDFNQEGIKKSWDKLVGNFSGTHNFQIIEVEVDVSNGYYIRQLVFELGKLMDVPMLALEIHRIKYL